MRTVQVPSKSLLAGWLPLGPISTEPYISPEFYEREKEKIFKAMEDAKTDIG